MSDTVKLAIFLRDRCEQGKYGLKYINNEKTLLFIPWPVAPKQNEQPSPTFEMFKEWAGISFKKRNQDQETNEQPTTQKHRFRNALSRADGIKYRKEIVVNGGRCYEFTESKSKRSHSNDSSQMLESPSRNDYENGYNPTPYDGAAYYNGFGGQIAIQSDPESPYTYDQQFNAPGDNFIEYRDQTQTPMWTEDEDQTVNELINIVGSSCTTEGSFLTNTPPLVEPQQSPQIVPLGVPVTRPVDGLKLSLRFRNEEVFQHFVTNESGCRLYYGDNIPDMSQLFEPEHLSSITRPFRYQPDQLFGPHFLEQVRLPPAGDQMRTIKQKEKTQSILQNMERGLLLCTDNSNSLHNFGIPDVYAMRLCQTRIFPYTETMGQMASHSESLKRMVWTKVFDAGQFCQKFTTEVVHPSSQICLSLGQRTTDEMLLVSLTVTVQRANQFIQNRLDTVHSDIFISGATSMDEEAQRLAMTLKATVTLN